MQIGGRWNPKYLTDVWTCFPYVDQFWLNNYGLLFFVCFSGGCGVLRGPDSNPGWIEHEKNSQQTSQIIKVKNARANVRQEQPNDNGSNNSERIQEDAWWPRQDHRLNMQYHCKRNI